MQNLLHCIEKTGIDIWQRLNDTVLLDTCNSYINENYQQKYVFVEFETFCGYNVSRKNNWCDHLTTSSMRNVSSPSTIICSYSKVTNRFHTPATQMKSSDQPLKFFSLLENYNIGSQQIVDTIRSLNHLATFSHCGIRTQQFPVAGKILRSSPPFLS